VSISAHGIKKPIVIGPIRSFKDKNIGFQLGKANNIGVKGLKDEEVSIEDKDPKYRETFHAD
jgi:hypothetical protein